MHVLGLLSLAVQVYFAIHAGKTGRYCWIFIILFFPMIGSIIYFFVEYMPEMQMSAKIKTARKSNKPKNIQYLKRELEITDSGKNKINLAEAYFHAGRYIKAIVLLEKSLKGIHAEDLDIIEGLSYAHFHNHTYDKSLEYLNEYERINNGTLPDNLRLIRAKSYEKIGETESAVKEYEAIINLCSGEEAICRYAQLLKKQGEVDKAKEVFGTILKNAKLYPKQYSTFEKEWVRIAKSEIK